MIEFRCTRPAAEAILKAVRALPVGEQANVEAFDAVRTALAMGDVPDSAPKAVGIRDTRRWVGLTPEDLAQLRVFIEGLLPWKHHIPYCERMLKAIEEAR